MPRKKKTTGRKSTTAKRTANPKVAKKRTAAKRPAKKGPTAGRKPKGASSARGNSKAKRSLKTASRASKGVSKATTTRGIGTRREAQAAKQAGPATIDVLSRAEADINAAIESLNNQMNSAVSTLTQLAASHREAQAPVIRTAPMDRVTAVFQRLVSEVVEEQLSEILPTLVSLRNEMAVSLSSEAADRDFLQRGKEMLDQVLAGSGVQEYDARPGQAYDPLIHLAVGETARVDLEDGVVSEWVAAGFRTARGKVLVPARVKVNRK